MELSDIGRRFFLGEKGPPPAPAARAAPAAFPRVDAKGLTYILLGHGNEDVVDMRARPRLPKGVTLVTVVDCGLVTPLERPGKMLKYLSENPEKRPYPELYQREISAGVGFPIHVYREGEQYPRLAFDPYAYQQGTMRFYLSGVVPVRSVDKDDIELMQNGSPKTNDAIRDLTRSFKRSKFPTLDMVLKARVPLIPIEQIFERLGGGVYYFVACRASAGPPKANIPAIQVESARLQEEKLWRAGSRRRTAQKRRKVGRRKRRSTRRRRI